MDCNGYYYIYQDPASLYIRSVIDNVYCYLYACLYGIFADDTEQKEGKTIMKIKQNKTIKILLAVALMFTAF